jgi:hypothetical protein
VGQKRLDKPVDEVLSHVHRIAVMVRAVVGDCLQLGHHVFQDLEVLECHGLGCLVAVNLNGWVGNQNKVSLSTGHT